MGRECLYRKRLSQGLTIIHSMQYTKQQDFVFGEEFFFKIRGSNGFDRDFEAGEAIRMQCVKWQN